MSSWSLPVDITVCGQLFAIRSDFRAVLDALTALNDHGLEDLDRRVTFVRVLVPDWRRLPDWGEALTALLQFVNLGEPIDTPQPQKPILIDWEQDAGLIAPAVDKVLGYSSRRCEYLHWWEFVGAYQCIGDGLFAQVVGIRAKRAKGKTLDKYEREFARENAVLVDRCKPKTTAAEEEFFKSLGV